MIEALLILALAAEGSAAAVPQQAPVKRQIRVLSSAPAPVDAATPLIVESPLVRAAKTAKQKKAVVVIDSKSLLRSTPAAAPREGSSAAAAAASFDLSEEQQSIAQRKRESDERREASAARRDESAREREARWSEDNLESSAPGERE